jgi:hypothetical protein
MATWRGSGWGGGESDLATIVVPFAWESRLSGIGDTVSIPGSVSPVVHVPAAWKGRRVLLNFGAVDYRAMVWVNGQDGRARRGRQRGRSRSTSRRLASGSNTLVVRPRIRRPIGPSRAASSWQPQSRSI